MKMVFKLPLLLLATSCITLRTFTINEKQPIKQALENIPEIKLVDCRDREYISKTSNLKTRKDTLKALGKPEYVASSSKGKQTAVYAKYNEYEKAWCYFIAITYERDLVIDKLVKHSPQ